MARQETSHSTFSTKPPSIDQICPIATSALEIQIPSHWQMQRQRTCDGNSVMLIPHGIRVFVLLHFMEGHSHDRDMPHIIGGSSSFPPLVIRAMDWPTVEQKMTNIMRYRSSCNWNRDRSECPCNGRFSYIFCTLDTGGSLHSQKSACDRI
jgi:hypothetical protein